MNTQVICARVTVIAFTVVAARAVHCIMHTIPRPRDTRIEGRMILIHAVIVANAALGIIINTRASVSTHSYRARHAIVTLPVVLAFTATGISDVFADSSAAVVQRPRVVRPGLPVSVPILLPNAPRSTILVRQATLQPLQLLSFDALGNLHTIVSRQITSCNAALPCRRAVSVGVAAFRQRLVQTDVANTMVPSAYVIIVTFLVYTAAPGSDHGLIFALTPNARPNHTLAAFRTLPA